MVRGFDLPGPSSWPPLGKCPRCGGSVSHWPSTATARHQRLPEDNSNLRCSRCGAAFSANQTVGLSAHEAMWEIRHEWSRRIPTIDVLNVGDGACSVMRCSGWPQCSHRMAVIDCGNWRASSAGPAQLLLDFLGDELPEIDTLIVTHFDEDHWGGLRELASLVQGSVPPHLPEFIRICYPGLPKAAHNVPAATLAFITTARGGAVNARELVRAWESVCRTDPVPVVEGDRLLLCGREYEVLWPPRRLPSRLEGRIGALLSELDRFAEALAAKNYSQLRDNLIKAYDRGARGFPQGPADRGWEPDEPGPPPLVARRAMGRTQDLDEASPPPMRPSVTKPRSTHSLDDVDLRWFPEPDRATAKELSRRLRRINNELSLVFHDAQHGDLIAFGDLEGAALKHVAGTEGLLPRYRTMLAPHHGSHRVPDGFPAAARCVAQAGRRHALKWDRHKFTHKSGCENTFDSGDIHIPGRRIS